jgi:hypothetical protein
MKKGCWSIIAFAIVLVLFAVFSTRIIFHDVPEYITIAKNFAGVDNVNLFSTHSLLYPLIIAPFLMIWPSLAMIKLVNCLWIFLIGMALFLWLKDKRVFILYAFSPLVWYVSIQTTPILPASFLFLLAYLFMKEDKIKGHLLYSGLFLGLSCAVYDPMILVSLFFVLIYLWDKNLSSCVKYVIAMFIGFIPRMILDFSLFGMPFYSLLRYFGTNLLITIGLNKNIGAYAISPLAEGLLVVVMISPLLFMLYRLKWKIYKREILFLLITGLIFLVRGSLLKYFMIILPIVLILLISALNKEEIKWHCILSVFLIAIMCFSYFTFKGDIAAENDIGKILKDYNVDYIITPGNDANNYASFSWQDKPKFVWYQDFEASLANSTEIRRYDFSFNPKIKLKDNLVISAEFARSENITYSNYILISKTKDVAGFEVDKCYDVLCTFKKANA